MSKAGDAPQPGDLIRQRFLGLFPSLPSSVIDQFVMYKAELLKANSTLSLLPASALAHTETTDFSDCVCASDLIFKQVLPDGPIFDLGSGNGFPGLIFGILHPEREIVLVEKDSHRAKFLQALIAAVSLKNVRVLASAIEDLPEGTVKVGVSRGFAPLSKAMLSTRKITDLNGTIFYLKGNNWPQELASVPSQLFTYWDAAVIGTYRLPESETDISVISTKKISK